ncbi:MAG: serine/threonine-protein kinase [Gemmatimonadales bacterium]
MATENHTGRTIAGYHLLEQVGEGGTAIVYKAEHPERGVCAVKILKERMQKDATAVKRFLREAGYGARVDHPSVVRTFEYDEDDGTYYLALEWVSGEPLSKFVERSGRIAPELVADIVAQLADGLVASHKVGIIHRDLKPENIVYDPETKIVKLLDFGIARDAQEAPSERLTRTGFFVGTLQYVAPEALSGELVGEAADIYSVAKIAYYMLTGVHPQSGRSPREVFQQLLTQPPTPLNQAVKGLKFPAELEAAIMKGLAREPSARQASVRELADDIARGIKSEPSSSMGGGFLGNLKSLLNRSHKD